MPYEDIFIVDVLNYWLADGFDASEQTDVLEWLGSGKTLADMLGEEASISFYSLERKQQIDDYLNVFDLHELQCYLNDHDDKPAVLLRMNSNGEFVFVAGMSEGTPAISTEWFGRHRERVLR
jgi:hypothetical protein